ncbi:aminoglycoside phosphotransferase family protein [Streptomyces sp. NPDC002067]
MTLHEDEIAVDEAVVRSLLAAQCPQWADLPLTPAGHGTDNTLLRLGDDLLVRLPRTPGTARSLRKEREWLPRLAPRLSWAVPEPVHAGAPTERFPLTWSVHRWIDGELPGPGTVRDWAAFGTDLAAFVQELHAVDLMGAVRGGDLGWYRGGGLRECDDWAVASLEACRGVPGIDADVLTELWRTARALPDAAGPRVWLHGDLKPTNLLVRAGRLHAVLDFGGLSVGLPDAEHAPVWDLPPEARHAYRTALDLSDATWSRARAWALAVGAAGLPYYRDSYPEFAAECAARLAAITADARGGR